MTRRALSLLAFLAALLASLIAAPAAHAGVLSPRCHGAQETITAAPVAATLPAIAWDCTDKPRDFRPERVLLRFELQADQPLPTALTTRISDFHAIHVLTVDEGGRVTTLRLLPADAEPLGQGFRMALPVPAAADGGQAGQVIVAIDRAWVAPLVSDAQLVDHVDDKVLPIGIMAVLTALCVLMLVSAVLDVVLYLIRPKAFLPWHVLSISGALLLSLTTSGLLTLFVPLDITTISALLPISSAMALCGGAMFAARLFEEGTLPNLTRRLLTIAAVVMLVVALIYAAKPPWMRGFGIDIYYIGILQLIALFILALFQALRRGSRVAIYQLVASIPIWVLVGVRIFTNLGAGDEPNDALVASVAAQTFEIVVTSIAALVRFIALLRQERDEDRAHAEHLARQTHIDPLTGLYNRRALDAQFAELRARGFDAMALLDLDYFKRVNDRYGHVVGDKVLQLCAACLSLPRDDDSRAFRLGGEEFLVLLRGDKAAERLEAMRAAIRERISGLIEDLDQPVTASAGLVEIVDHGGPVPLFEDLYKQADALLYRAKAAGRDRIETLRLTCFPPGGQRRPALTVVQT